MLSAIYNLVWGVGKFEQSLQIFFYIFLTVFIVSGCTGYFDTNKQDSLVDVLDSTKQEFTLKYGEMDTFILKQREDGS